MRKMTFILLLNGLAVAMLAGCEGKAPEKNIQPKGAPVQAEESASIPSQSDTEIKYRLGPAVSVVEGTLHQVTFFGPPGYGADPENDAQESGFVLTLQTPITVRKEDGSPAVESVTEIQLIDQKAQLTKYKGLRMRITGVLDLGEVPTYHMAIIMRVQRIEEL